MGPPDIGMQGADLLHRLSWPYGIPLMPYWMGRMYWRTQTLARFDLNEDTRLRMVLQELRNAPEKDRDICTDVDLLRLAVRSWTMAFAQGHDDVWDDGVKSCMPFGFRIEDIRKDLKVQLWYGKNDANVPPLHGYQIAARLGGRAQLRMEEETHAGIYVHLIREILEAIRDSM
jgi:pimeloyl-ACP methyl ester carboxylesterase